MTNDKPKLDVSAVTGNVLKDYRTVYAGVRDIIGKEPVESEMAMAGVNTAFIELGKRLSKLPAKLIYEPRGAE